MKPTFLASLTMLTALTSTQAAGFSDDFATPEKPGRVALRGAWTFEGNVAHCIADPELYKKYKNHGPILRWEQAFTDGTLSFEFKPVGCQRLVFTLNEAGHVFRIALSDEDRTRIFGWATRSSKTNKPTTLIKEGVPPMASIDGQWTRAEIAIKGDKAQVTIGDFTCDLQHACIARKKGEVTISFASGALSVRKVKLSR